MVVAEVEGEKEVLGWECVWSEILITGVYRVTLQLMEAVLGWGGCDELPTVFF